MGDDKLLGTFEEAVLATVIRLGRSAGYGMAIWEDVVERSGHTYSMGTVHATLQRLDNKGYVKSELRDARPERGERRRRYYEITGLGQEAMVRTRAFRDRTWEDLDELVGEPA